MKIQKRKDKQLKKDVMIKTNSKNSIKKQTYLENPAPQIHTYTNTY